MEIGDRVERPFRITDAELTAFAEISGDWNPVHFDDAFAARSIFGRRIAHGMISLAKFSGIFGMDMPGLGTLWETQEVRFLAPVYLDIDYVAIAEVVEKDRRRATIATWVEDGERNRVLEGRGVVVPIGESTRKRLI
jgi:3-hydroxybutyryl-CoA dehydratase